MSTNAQVRDCKENKNCIAEKLYLYKDNEWPKLDFLRFGCRYLHTTHYYIYSVNGFDLFTCWNVGYHICAAANTWRLWYYIICTSDLFISSALFLVYTITILYFVSIILCVLRIPLFTPCLQYSPRVWSSRNRFISFGYTYNGNIMCNVPHNIILEYIVPI